MNRYTHEQEEYIKQFASLYTRKELVKEYNKKFNSNVSFDGLEDKIKRMGLSKKHVVKHYTFTNEEIKFLKNNCKGVSNKQLTELLNKKFNKNLKVSQIERYKYSHNLKSGIKCGEKPLYSERIHNGHVEIKIRNSKNYKNNYIRKSHFIWEKYYGKIPKGYSIVFKDHNKTNFDINNLLLVKNNELLYLAKNDLITTNDKVTSVALLIKNINSKLKKYKKNNQVI